MGRRSRRPRVGRHALVAAVFLTAVTSLALPAVLAGPATAASCSSANGVTVVVDFKGLGGGVQQACDASGGGKNGASLFTDNGFPLAYVQRQPGFVCRVSGVPADDPCVSTPPADAYWGLWWSDGESGTWTYASQGAGSLTIPEGGYVAFAWDGVSGSPPPGVSPAVHAAEPTPTHAPSPQPTPAPTRSPSTGGGPAPSATEPGQVPSNSTSTSPSATTSDEPSSSPSATKSTKPEKSDSAVPSTSVPQSPSATESAVPSPSAASGADAGLPGWVAPSLIGALFLAAGAAANVRRRRGSTGG